MKQGSQLRCSVVTAREADGGRKQSDLQHGRKIFNKPVSGSAIRGLYGVRYLMTVGVLVLVRRQSTIPVSTLSLLLTDLRYVTYLTLPCSGRHFMQSDSATTSSYSDAAPVLAPTRHRGFAHFLVGRGTYTLGGVI